MSSRFRTGGAHEPKREIVPLIDETLEAESGSLEDADAGLGEAAQARMWSSPMTKSSTMRY
jgi:hypothetical protein